MVLLVAAVNIQAQQIPPVERAPVPDFSKVEIKTTRLADDRRVDCRGAALPIRTPFLETKAAWPGPRRTESGFGGKCASRGAL
jgi:hypothetical protein